MRREDEMATYRIVAETEVCAIDFPCPIPISEIDKTRGKDVEMTVILPRRYGDYLANVYGEDIPCNTESRVTGIGEISKAVEALAPLVNSDWARALRFTVTEVTDGD